MCSHRWVTGMTQWKGTGEQSVVTDVHAVQLRREILQIDCRANSDDDSILRGKTRRGTIDACCPLRAQARRQRRSQLAVSFMLPAAAAKSLLFFAVFAVVVVVVVVVVASGWLLIVMVVVR